jgi:hypothetical protein
MDVFTVDDHHHALHPWSIVRRQLDSPPNLITLDHHTDTITPFNKYLYNNLDWRADMEPERATLLQSVDWRSDEAICSAISKLAYDEHIQTATLTEILNFAFVINLDCSFCTLSVEEMDWEEKHPHYLQRRLNNEKPPKPPFSYSAPENKIFCIGKDYSIGCSKEIHDNECYRRHCDLVIETEYLTSQLMKAGTMADGVGILDLQASPYILDIDLDAFHTQRAATPTDPTRFHDLIRHATAISIAIEEGCTQTLKVEGESISTEWLLESLYDHIATAQQ